MNHYRTQAADRDDPTPIISTTYTVPALLTVDETADILRCSHRTVQRLCKRGDLDYVRPNISIRITVASLLKYIGATLNRRTPEGQADTAAHTPAAIEGWTGTRHNGGNSNAGTEAGKVTEK